MLCLNSEGGTLVVFPNTCSSSLGGPWLINFELPEDNADFFVPAVGCATLVLYQLQIAFHLDRTGIVPKEFDLLGWNSERYTEAHLEGMTRVKTKGQEHKSVGQGVVEEGVDVRVVDGEEEVEGVVVGHCNLGELWDVVSGYEDIQLVVAGTAASCLNIPV